MESTTRPATKLDKGKPCLCGHAIYVIRGQVKCFCDNPRVWTSVFDKK